MSPATTADAPAEPRSRALAAWLLHPARDLPDAAALRAAELAAYAYATLPPDHPGRAELRGDYLAALTRHHRIRAELIPLVAAWNAAGIEPLVFKGFHLAELVYPAPGMRFHGDVDVLVRPEQVEAAGEVARGLGWSRELDMAAWGQPFSHNACTLYGPGGAAAVDLHRWALHCVHPWNRVQRRITRAVWDASVPIEWEGVRVREMAPADAILVGLVLQRCWGGDRWHLKPHDAVDFRLLLERRGASREALVARARELGAARTLSLFLERCDPAAGRLDLRPPTAADLRRWDREAFPERGLLGARELALGRAVLLPRAAVAVAAALPALLAARAALRRHRDVATLLGSLDAEVRGRPRSLARRYLTVQGVRWGLRLLPGNPRGDCLVRSLALYHALRRQGWPVRFVSGVRRDAGGVVGHAWVELDGRVLPELDEPDNRRHYAVNLEHPPGASGLA